MKSHFLKTAALILFMAFAPSVTFATASQNTQLGPGGTQLPALTTGINNEAIGGIWSGLTTGSNNVIIGGTSNCDVTSATTSNELDICGSSTSVIKVTGMGTPSSSVLTVAGTQTNVGALTAPAFIPNGSSLPVNGLYLPGANTPGIAANSLGVAQFVTSGASVNQILFTGTATGTPATITEGGSGSDANRKLVIQGAGTGVVELGQTVCTVAASGNAGTCNGQKGVYTTASLSTAHSAASTAQVITNSSVTATSVVVCNVEAYSGTIGTNGNPTVICIPSANTITATVVNAADTNALSGTVGIGFFVVN